MRSIKLTLIILIFIPMAATAGDKGNGGFGLKCGSKVEILDLYEARNVHRLTVNLGAPNLSVEDKIEIMLERLAKWMPNKAAYFQQRANEFFPVHGEILGNRIVIIANKEALKEGKQPPLDIGNTIIPDNCDIVAMARNFTAKQSPTYKSRAYIFSDSWNLADNDSKAVLILHELFFMENPTETSQTLRYMMAYLTSEDFDSLTYAEWQDMAKDTIGIEFKGIEISNGFVNYHQNGLPKSTYGYVRVLQNFKTVLNGETVDLRPSHDKEGNLNFNEKGQPLGGYIVASPQEKLQLSILDNVSVTFDSKNLEPQADSGIFVKMDDNHSLQEALMSKGAKAVFETSDKVKVSATKINIDQDRKIIELSGIVEKFNEIAGGPSREVQIDGVELNEDSKIMKFYTINENGPLYFLPGMSIYNGGRQTWWPIGSGRYKFNSQSLSISGDLLDFYRDEKDNIWTGITLKVGEIVTRLGSDEMCATAFEWSPRENNSNRDNFTLHTKAGKKFILPKQKRTSFTIDKDGVPLTLGCRL